LEIDDAWIAEWVDHRHFEELDSTQSYVEREYESFDQGKLTVVSADFQTAGRGTGERSWLATPKRSVLVSFFFRFPSECSTEFVNRCAPNATKVLALSAVNTLRWAAEGGLDVDGRALEFGIKWPNDVVANGRKIGGILARAVPSGMRLDAVILGIGVNINTPQADLAAIDRPVWPATSLHALFGGTREFDVKAVRDRMVGTFATELRSYFRGGFPAFRDRINSLDVLMGTQVRFRLHSENIIEAEFAGVDDDGLILLRLESGEVKAFPSGEIVPPAERT